jgi:hypothetical protein
VIVGGLDIDTVDLLVSPVLAEIFGTGKVHFSGTRRDNASLIFGRKMMMMMTTTTTMGLLLSVIAKALIMMGRLVDLYAEQLRIQKEEVRKEVMEEV